MENKLFSPKEAFHFAAKLAREQTAELMQKEWVLKDNPENLFRDLRRANFEMMKRYGFIAV